MYMLINSSDIYVVEINGEDISSIWSLKKVPFVDQPNEPQDKILKLSKRKAKVANLQFECS